MPQFAGSGSVIDHGMPAQVAPPRVPKDLPLDRLSQAFLAGLREMRRVAN